MFWITVCVSPLYLVTQKKKYFNWGPNHQQSFEHLKQDTAPAVAFGPVQTGTAVRNALHCIQRPWPHLEPLWENTLSPCPAGERGVSGYVGVWLLAEVNPPQGYMDCILSKLMEKPC